MGGRYVRRRHGLQCVTHETYPVVNLGLLVRGHGVLRGNLRSSILGVARLVLPPCLSASFTWAALAATAHGVASFVVRLGIDVAKGSLLPNGGDDGDDAGDD